MNGDTSVTTPRHESEIVDILGSSITLQQDIDCPNDCYVAGDRTKPFPHESAISKQKSLGTKLPEILNGSAEAPDR